MSLVTANGSDVSEARLTFPLTGAWHADLFIDSQNNMTGAVSVDLAGDLTLTGTVLTGGIYTESLFIRVIAGKGGWVKPCSPKYYLDASLGTILRDILAQGGETLSATSDAGPLAVVPRAFASTSGSVGANVRALMAYAPSTSFRFLPDGSFWIGAETWPAFGADYTVTNEQPAEQRLEIGFASPSLIAGQSVQAEAGMVHVNRVETSISAQALRARAWWQS